MFLSSIKSDLVAFIVSTLSKRQIIHFSIKKSNQIVSNIQEDQEHLRQLSHDKSQINIDAEFEIGLCCMGKWDKYFAHQFIQNCINDDTVDEDNSFIHPKEEKESK